jgi:hypothetical protein
MSNMGRNGRFLAEKPKDNCNKFSVEKTGIEPATQASQKELLAPAFLLVSQCPSSS